MKTRLKSLVELDTTNPPGNEIIAARYLEKEADRDGISGAIFISTGTRASFIARLKGSGRKRPIVLMCHTDVVPADRKRWTMDPFGADEKNGYIYGRGTADVKGMCAAELEVLSILKRSGAALDRDVIFFAEADEESGVADRHIDWLLKNHWNELDAEFALNEGGDTIWDHGSVRAIHVQAAEKQYVDVKLIARGTSGHASVPRPDNPVFTLGRALARLSAYEPPVEVNPIVRRFLREEVRLERPALAPAIDALNAPRSEAAARELTLANPEIGAMLRDTINATMLQAGVKSNVIPAQAEAILNCRLLPGETTKDFIDKLRQVIREPAVEVQLDSSDAPAVPPMPTDTALFHSIEEATRMEYPHAAVTPFMSAWSTDSQVLRARGVVTYGFHPPLEPGDKALIHGDDERISIEALNAYLRLLYRTVLLIAK